MRAFTTVEIHDANPDQSVPSWEELCEEVNVFLNGVPSENIITVSHVSESPFGVAFAWYKAGDASGKDQSD